MSLEEEMANPSDEEIIHILHQRLQTAQEENELAKQLIFKTLEDFGLSNYDWQADQNEITTELQTFIQQNKQMREAIKRALSFTGDGEEELNLNEIAHIHYTLQQALIKINRKEKLQELTKLSQELGLYDDITGDE